RREGAAMAVRAVHLEADAFLVCLNHALSTEKEEVMGLCIGQVPPAPRGEGERRGDTAAAAAERAESSQSQRPPQQLPPSTAQLSSHGNVDTSRIVHIHSVIILRRSDKRKDRVEISPEQLSAASTEAEISFLTQQQAHQGRASPQAAFYVLLAEMTGRPMRVVGWYHSHPHITVWPSHVDVRTQAMYQMMDQGFVGLIFSCFIEDKNTKTGRILYTCFQSIQAQKSSEKPAALAGLGQAVVGLWWVFAGLKLIVSFRYERIEIPIHVVPHETIGKVCLESAVELPKILCQEEQDAYRRIHSLTHLDSVTKIHNGSVFTKNLCSQMSAISGPLLQWLEDRLEQNKQRVQELQQEKEQLLEELAALE
ncbi:BRCC3 deubiquitinase, partial [Urocolius indicus]|nr:BRCC3 deubiquitinase [Urocolius indicus]